MTPFLGMIARYAVSTFFAVLSLYLAIAESWSIGKTDRVDQPRMEAGQFATDDHRLLVDAQHPPYSAIGKFRGAMTCTASVVLHPRIIVTAGHCITKRDGTLKASNLLFEPGYQAGTDLGQFKAALWAVGSKQSFGQESAQEASRDWAILVLDHAPMGVSPLLLTRQSLEALKSLGRQILMPSYSIDVADAERISLDPACSIRNMIWDALVHNCRASFGSSGAPLLIRVGPRFAIVGIHTGSMYASDNQGHVGRFVGNRAISSATFSAELFALSRHLKSDGIHQAFLEPANFAQ